MSLFSFSEGENQRGFQKGNLRISIVTIFKFSSGETEAQRHFWFSLSTGLVTLLIIVPDVYSCPTLCQVLEVQTLI